MFFCFYVFSESTSAPKIPKKFRKVYFFTLNNHEFFQNFWSQCASHKNHFSYRYFVQIFDRLSTVSNISMKNLNALQTVQETGDNAAGTNYYDSF